MSICYKYAVTCVISLSNSKMENLSAPSAAPCTCFCTVRFLSNVTARFQFHVKNGTIMTKIKSEICVLLGNYAAHSGNS